MVMSAPYSEWTVDMVHDLPDDGNRIEVIDGELLVSPAPSYLHQEAVMQLYKILLPYVQSIGQHIVVAPASVTFSERREVQPDLFVLPKRRGRRPTRLEDVRKVTLVVEVVSPNTERADRTTKKGLYQEERVPEYWIVDPDSRTVERWRPESAKAELFATTLAWHPIPTRDALTIDLASYFRSVHDET